MSNDGTPGGGAAAGRRPAGGPSGNQGLRRRPGRATIWRRRITVLVVLLAALALIIWALTALWGVIWVGDEDPTPSVPTESVTESASDALAAGGDPVACGSGNVALDLTVTGRYAGAPVDLLVDVANSGDVDCLLDAGPGNMTVEISSGTDPVWSSLHCTPEGERMLLLGPDDTSEALLTWPGVRSAEGCPAGAAGVQPGTYRAQVLLDGVAIAGADSTFTLEQAPPPEPPTDGEAPSDG